MSAIITVENLSKGCDASVETLDHKLHTGLLINFNVPSLKQGIKWMVL
jgi:hypothetical protein